uniref:Secreted protein n=1 Tax=Chaetoceros debilis TaxID=122233 RepID=A0A7S3V5D8_9STRA
MSIIHTHINCVHAALALAISPTTCCMTSRQQSYFTSSPRNCIPPTLSMKTSMAMCRFARAAPLTVSVKAKERNCKVHPLHQERKLMLWHVKNSVHHPSFSSAPSPP